MLHLRTRLLEIPPKDQSDILHQMARKLHMPYVSRMIERTDVIMLQDAGGVEVVHEALSVELVERAILGKVPYHCLNLGGEAGGLAVCVAYLVCIHESVEVGLT